MRTISVTDEATTWLIRYLTEHGDTPRAELGEVAPYSARTLERAATRAGVTSRSLPTWPRRTIWGLPR
jgi:hypothetical protein